MCDVQVRVGDRVFHVHRLVLAAESAYFCTLFNGSFPDASASTLTLADMTPSTFELVLQFMYKRNCLLPTRDLQSVLEAACRLAIPSLQASAEAAVIDRLGPENSVHALCMAEGLVLVRLAKAAEAVVLANFEALEPTLIKELSAETFGAVLGADALHIKHEERAFEAITQWVDGQASPPPPDVVRSLLSHVRFPFMSIEYLMNTVEKHPMVLEHPMVLATAFREAFGQQDTARARKRACMDWQPFTDIIHKRLGSWHDGLRARLIDDLDAVADNLHEVGISLEPSDLACMAGVEFVISNDRDDDDEDVGFLVRHPQNTPLTGHSDRCLCFWSYSRNQVRSFQCKP